MPNDQINAMEQAAHLIPSKEGRIAYLDSLFRAEEHAASQHKTANAFDLLRALHKQGDLSPEETLAFLNRRDKNGMTFGMYFTDQSRYRQFYLEFLSQLMDEISGQAILDHLLLTEYISGQTLAHQYPINELVDILCKLRSKEDINLNSFNHLIVLKEHGQENIVTKINSLRKKSADVLSRLLSEHVLPENCYQELTDLLDPLLKSIIQLPEDKTDPLYVFAKKCAVAMTKKSIIKAEENPGYNNNGDLNGHVMWLTHASLPIAIKRACLDVCVTAPNRVTPSYLESNIPTLKTGVYFEYLKNLLSSGMPPKDIVKYLFRYCNNSTNKSLGAKDCAQQINLLAQLARRGVKPSVIINYLKKANIKSACKDIYRETSYFEALLSLFETLVEKNATPNSLIRISHETTNFIALGTRLANLDAVLVTRFIALLQSMAKSYSNDHSLIIELLSKENTFYPHLSVFESIIKNNATCIPSLINLLCDLRNQGVPLKTIHKIWESGVPQNDYAANKMIEYAKKDSQVLFNLINNDLLPQKYIKQLKNLKKELLTFILEKLPGEDCIKALINASTDMNPPHALYRFMMLRRGFFLPSQGAGTLKEINDDLLTGILDENGNDIDSISTLLSECVKNKNQLLKKRVEYKLVKLSQTNSNILLKLLINNLIPIAEYRNLIEHTEVVPSLIYHIKRLPQERKRAVIIEAFTHNSALRRFSSLNLQLKVTLKIELKNTFSKDMVCDIENQLKINESINEKNSEPEKPVRIAKKIKTSTARVAKTLRASPAKPELSDIEMVQRQACARETPAIYELIYGEQPQADWQKKPEQKIESKTPVVNDPPAYDVVMQSRAKPASTTSVSEPSAPPATPPRITPAPNDVDSYASIWANLLALPSAPVELPVANSSQPENEEEERQALLA